MTDTKPVPKSTMVELVAELGTVPTSEGLREMITLAKGGEFHDFKSSMFPCPKVKLVEMLHAEAKAWPPGFVKNYLGRVRDAVIDGQYDEQADADDLAEMRKTAPRELWPVLGLDEEDGS